MDIIVYPWISKSVSFIIWKETHKSKTYIFKFKLFSNKWWSVKENHFCYVLRFPKSQRNRALLKKNKHLWMCYIISGFIVNYAQTCGSDPHSTHIMCQDGGSYTNSLELKLNGGFGDSIITYNTNVLNTISCMYNISYQIMFMIYLWQCPIKLTLSVTS